MVFGRSLSPTGVKVILTIIVILGMSIMLPVATIICNGDCKTIYNVYSILLIILLAAVFYVIYSYIQSINKY